MDIPLPVWPLGPFDSANLCVDAGGWCYTPGPEPPDNWRPTTTPSYNGTSRHYRNYSDRLDRLIRQALGAKRLTANEVAAIVTARSGYSEHSVKAALRLMWLDNVVCSDRSSLAARRLDWRYWLP